MTVNEFITMESSGEPMYRVVDASLKGYKSCPKVLYEADRNMVRELYGSYNLVGFEVATKKTIVLYVKEG